MRRNSNKDRCSCGFPHLEGPGLLECSCNQEEEVEDWSPMKYKVVKVVVAGIVAVVVVIRKRTTVVVVVICKSTTVAAERSEPEAIVSVASIAAVLVGVNIFQDKCNIH
ncbi:hypothetical protein RHMOL_Rhmol07G0212800 [Rhododendron molle]|uniref:Uncharacterized protein n=1 Tax=Rhododendron molle TaxID=49168 RepID=A0ACC0N2V4_RHOML|nr:hypothetical protein RHMOL_Rhmol07G0212800 [Rhododendron molle]